MFFRLKLLKKLQNFCTPFKKSPGFFPEKVSGQLFWFNCLKGCVVRKCLCILPLQQCPQSSGISPLFHNLLSLLFPLVVPLLITKLNCIAKMKAGLRCNEWSAALLVSVHCFVRTALYWTALSCTALHFNALHRKMALFCLDCTALEGTVLHFTALLCTVLHCPL